MTEKFVGCTISIEVGGGLGFYQGRVKGVNTEKQLITLTKVFHNGILTKPAEVSIHGADILDMKILHSNDGNDQRPAGKIKGVEVVQKLSLLKPSQVSSSTTKKVVNATKNLAAGSGEVQRITSIAYGEKSSSQKECDAKDRTTESKCSFQPFNWGSIEARNYLEDVGPHDENLSLNSPMYLRNNNEICNVAEGILHKRNLELPKTPKKKMQWKKLWRDETTFGTPIDEEILNTEFDFEKNLALFDKQAVMEEIENRKPDVICQADWKSYKKYRSDENITTTKPLVMPPQKKQIIVPPAEAGEIVYTTDNGILVPSVSKELRGNLLSTANQFGLTKSRQLEMMGRAATEIILSVIGGSHRLEPGNIHQAPVVVFLCGVHMQGAAGVNCGRQLEGQGVQTVVVNPSFFTASCPSLLFSQEMQLYSLTSGRLESDTSLLPTTVDLIVDARFDLECQVGLEASDWINMTNAWASLRRAPILLLDPPPLHHPLTPRIILSPSLPLAYNSEKGKVYLLNLNIPQQVFSSLKIAYISPFGAKMVIPLHPCD